MVNLSIIIPIYKGEKFISQLVNEIITLNEKLKHLQSPFLIHEIILVTDEPVDNSESVCKNLSEKFDNVYNITLSKNYGQHAATCAGILHAQGDWVITMDEDLQHDPKYIVNALYHATASNVDVVYIKNIGIAHSPFREVASRFSKYITAKICGNNQIQKFSSFRLMRGVLARASAAVFSVNGYFDITLTWFTHRMDVLEFHFRDKRKDGGVKSGYNFRKLLSHFKKLFLASNVKVLRIFAFLGILGVISSLLILVWVLSLKFSNSLSAPGWASLMVIILFLGSIQLFLISTLIEIISSFSEKIKGHPPYQVINRSEDKYISDWIKLNMKDVF